jgi:hypothetical protein
MSDDGLPSGLPTVLPNEDFLIERMGMSANVAASARPFLAMISATTLGLISRATSIPFGVRTVLSEAMYYRGTNPYLIPRFWPVRQVVSAFAGASTAALRPGTEYLLARGLCDIAITAPAATGDSEALGGETLTVAPDWWAPGLQFFVSYTAGIDSLPADMLEIYSECAFLMWKEKERVGLSQTKDKDGEIRFQRHLPPWALRSLRGYQRIVSIV